MNSIINNESKKESVFAGIVTKDIQNPDSLIATSDKKKLHITKNITDKTGSDYNIVISDVLDMTYTGEDIEPTVTLTWNGVALKTEDYTLTYKNNKEVGVATITITAMSPGTNPAPRVPAVINVPIWYTRNATT